MTNNDVLDILRLQKAFSADTAIRAITISRAMSITKSDTNRALYEMMKTCTVFKTSSANGGKPKWWTSSSEINTVTGTSVIGITGTSDVIATVAPDVIATNISPPPPVYQTPVKSQVQPKQEGCEQIPKLEQARALPRQMLQQQELQRQALEIRQLKERARQQADQALEIQQLKGRIQLMEQMLQQMYLTPQAVSRHPVQQSYVYSQPKHHPSQQLPQLQQHREPTPQFQHPPCK